MNFVLVTTKWRQTALFRSLWSDTRKWRRISYIMNYFLLFEQLSERKLKTCKNETEIELGMKWFSSTDIRLRFFSFFEDCVNKNLQLFERIEKWFYTSNSTYFWYFILFKLSLILVIFHVPPKEYPAIANRDYSFRDMHLIFSCN